MGAPNRGPTTPDMLAKARASAKQRRGGAAFRESGPVVELLLERDLTAEHTRRIVQHFTRGLRPEMLGLVKRPFLDTMDLDAEEAVAAAGGEITFQVHVVATSTGNAAVAETEHLVDVLAHDHLEAELIAVAMTSCRSPMPLVIRTVTDSTLTVF